MDIYLTIILLTHLLLVMENINSALAKEEVLLTQRTAALEQGMRELKTRIKMLEECKACTKISELQQTIDSKADTVKCPCDTDYCGDNNAVCRVPKPFTCKCKAGYTRNGTTNCADVDECDIIGICDDNANCKNTGGSYSCSCKAGFTGDGKTCADVDECSDHATVCDANADCQNTNGSYSCSCKPGFTGEGDTCSDIDECVSGIHDCHSSASCTNTVGSYNCSCNFPYAGNGKKCTLLPPECQTYTRLTNADRKITYPTSSPGQGKCDDDLRPGWFRFQGDAGTRMPTSCPPRNSCNTDMPGWLTGAHPTEAQGKLTRLVCFHHSYNCCYRSAYVPVRNCGSYYVYNFNKPPTCNLRYCSTD